MKIAPIALTLAALALTAAQAQNPKKNVVVIESTTRESDILGRLLISDLRDVIAQSPRWREASQEIGPLGTTMTVSLDPMADTDQSATYVAVVFSVNDLYLRSSIFIHCGANKIAECARMMIPGP